MPSFTAGAPAASATPCWWSRTARQVRSRRPVGLRGPDAPARRDLPVPLGPPALPRAPPAQRRRQGARGRPADGHGPPPARGPGSRPGDRARACERRRRRARRGTGRRRRLLSGRFRCLHRPPGNAGHRPPGGPDRRPPRAPLRRGTPAAQDRPRHAPRATGAEARVPRHELLAVVDPLSPEVEDVKDIAGTKAVSANDAVGLVPFRSAFFLRSRRVRIAAKED